MTAVRELLASGMSLEVLSGVGMGGVVVLFDSSRLVLFPEPALGVPLVVSAPHNSAPRISMQYKRDKRLFMMFSEKTWNGSLV